MPTLTITKSIGVLCRICSILSTVPRTLSLLNQCEPIEYSKTNADGIIISPVYHEISNEVYEKITQESGFIILDPQGFLRRTDSEGKASVLWTLGSTIGTQTMEIYYSYPEGEHFSHNPLIFVNAVAAEP